MNKVHKIAELFQLIEMVKSAATVHLGKMHKLTELDQPVITIKMIQTVHVNKVLKVAILFVATGQNVQKSLIISTR